jgi:hypothetical protein
VRRRLTLILVTWPALAAGCSLLTDLSGLANGTRDGGGAAADGPLVDSGDAAAPNEAAPNEAGARCDLNKPFGAPVPLAPLNLPTENERSARLTPDELTIYFASDRTNLYRIYRATRAKPDDAFGAPVQLDELASSAVNYRTAAPTPDDRSLIIEQRMVDGGGGRGDLVIVTRATSTGPFGAPTNIGGLNTFEDETDPQVTAAGLELWFARSAGTSSYDIFMSSRSELTEPFANPSRLSGSLNQPASSETDAVPSADGLELFLQTSREGKMRIYVARRDSKADPFGAPVHVPELDGLGANDVPTWLSPDRCVLYLTSFSPAAVADIYVAKRPP